MRMLSCILLAFVLMCSSVSAVELATSIVKGENSARIESIGYAKLNLLKEDISLSGNLVSSGKLTVEGTANVVMWVKVDENYYFSRLPALQNVKDKAGVDFVIPFNAGTKTATEVVLEIELYGKGSVTVDQFQVASR